MISFKLIRLLLKYRFLNNLSFNVFMKSEISFYSQSYSRNFVKIHGAENVIKLENEGAVLVFLHFGSFFLTGGALTNQLGINYTAVASKRNLEFLSPNENSFWNKVHSISENLYGNKLFYTDNYPRSMINWLNKGNFLGVALDVNEKGINHQFSKFKLFNTNYNFQTAAYRLAEITNKKIIAMLIFYDKKKFRHNLYLSHPFDVGNPNNCIQDCLNFMEPHMCKYKNQFFHDIDKCFKVHV